MILSPFNWAREKLGLVESILLGAGRLRTDASLVLKRKKSNIKNDVQSIKQDVKDNNKMLQQILREMPRGQ